MTHKIIRFTLAIAAAAAVVISRPALATLPDACALLSAVQIGTIVAVPMGSGVALNSSTASSCKWEQQGMDPFRAVTVIVSTKSIQAYEMGKGVMHPTAVSGIGDEAYMTGKSLSYTVLSVKKGQSALTVTVRGLKDVASTQAAEMAVGKAAAAKL